jgi:hypothetical protein
MSTAVPHRVDMSTFFTSSGILQLNTCPICVMLVFPKFRLWLPLSSGVTASPQRR